MVKNKKSQSIVPVLIGILLITVVFSVGFMTEDDNKITGMATKIDDVGGLVKVTGEEAAEETASEYIRKERVKDQSEKQIYSAVSSLLNQYLGEFAYEKIADFCKEEWEASEPSSNTPRNVNPGTTNPLTPIDQETLNITQGQSLSCANSDKTTLAAQGTRTAAGAEFNYDVSYTVAACKQNIQYTVYLANAVDDKEAIDFGTANKGEVKADIKKQFPNSKSYDDICIQVSDNSIGNMGFACFPLVV